MKSPLRSTLCLLLLTACRGTPVQREAASVAPDAGRARLSSEQATPTAHAEVFDVAKAAPSKALTLEEALALAERTHPELVAASARIAAARGDLRQAGRLDNPEASLTIESAPVHGETLDNAEYVLGLSQAVPIGGRLGAAEEVAELELRRAELELDATRLEVRDRVRGAFAAMLYAQRAAELRLDLQAQSRSLSDLIEQRVLLGDAVQVELLDAELAGLDTDRELRRSQTLLTRARRELAAALGEAKLEIHSITGELGEAAALPAIEEVLARVEANPLLLAAQAGVAADEARVTQALAERVPDLQLQLFYRRIEAEDENAFDLGIGTSLPLFDRKRGRIDAARSRAAASRAELRATQQDLLSSAWKAYERLAMARTELELVEERLLPRISALLELHEARHAAGDIALDELIEARTRAATAELTRLEAFRDTLSAWVELAPFVAP